MNRILLSSAILAMASISGFAGLKSSRVLVSNEKFENYGALTTSVERVAPKADGSMNFGFAGDPYTAYNLSQTTGMAVYQCVELDSLTVGILKGDKITEITTYSGVNQNYVNPDRNIQLFISTDLAKEPVYTQKATASSTAFAKNVFKLTTPFEITGETPVYVGYYFIASANTQYPVVVDGFPCGGNTAIVGLGADKGYPTEFYNYSSQIGSINISATVEGPSIPQNLAMPKGITLPLVADIANIPEYYALVLNNGKSDISNLEFKVVADNEEVAIIPVSLTEAEDNGIFDVDIDGVKYANEGKKVINIYITKVNGVDNPYANSVVSSWYVVSPTIYDRKLVMEEGTGCWCGYCPAGIVMMEYLKEKYDDSVYRIAVHGGQGSDLMKLPSTFANNYNGWLNNYISGFPGATLNRELDVAPTADDILDDLDDAIEDYLKVGTYAKAFLETKEYDPETDMAKFYTYTDFGADNPGNHYISLAVVQDGMGPYNQQNYYANASYGLGEMDGWEKKGNPVSTIYDDVARGLTSCPGISLTPGSIKKGLPYFATLDLNMKYVTSDDFRAVFMVTNEDGVIVAADQVSMKKSAITNTVMEKSAPVINAGKGSINVAGADNVAVYSLTGAKVANGSVNNIPAGIYVVKADNKVVKVMVK